MDKNVQKYETGIKRTLQFLAGLMAGVMAGAATMLMVAPQSGAKTRLEIKNKGLELKDEAAEGITQAGRRIQSEAAVWQERGKGVSDALNVSKDDITQAVSESKDNIAQAVSDSKDRVVAAVADSKESGR